MNFIKSKIQEMIFSKCNQYLEEMNEINRLKAIGFWPKDTLGYESANLNYALLELKLNALLAFVPTNTG
jgi:hypothetical protein